MSDFTPSSPDVWLQQALRVLRSQLNMEVAFISRFQDGLRTFRCVDASPEFSPIAVGQSDPLEDSYCQRVVDGRLPSLLVDAQLNDEALSIAATQALPIGAHLSVPLYLSGGQLYGTLCCFSRKANTALSACDVKCLQLYGALVSQTLEVQLHEDAQRQARYDTISRLIQEQSFSPVYQPIWDIEQGRVLGYEMLTRFSALPAQNTEQWFLQAGQVGLRTELELATIRKALPDLAKLPFDTYLSINLSPETLVTAQAQTLLSELPWPRVVVEITEHSFIEDYGAIAEAIEPWRAKGLRLAVDDAGAGYASFRHIIRLHPDIVKLDISLVAHIDHDLVCRALTEALSSFAAVTNSLVVAEGVETPEQLAVLRNLRIGMAQGYLLGRPQSMGPVTPML